MKSPSDIPQPTPREEVICYLLSLLETGDHFNRVHLQSLVKRLQTEASTIEE